MVKKKLKITQLVMAVAIALSAFGTNSCTSGKAEEPEVVPESTLKTYTLVGGFEPETDSRMAFDAPTSSYSWEAGDVLRLYNAQGTYIASHIIDSTEIKASGKVIVSVRLRYEPKYISISSEGDCDYVTINASTVNGYAVEGNKITGIPVLAQSVLTANSQNQISFSMKHKLSSVYFKNIKLDGTQLEDVCVTAVGAKVSLGDITDENSSVKITNTTTQTNKSVKIYDGTNHYAIVVAPGTSMKVSINATSSPFLDATLGSGFYKVERIFGLEGFDKPIDL